MPHSIQTFTGTQFYFDYIDPDTICIKDIAHSLSLLCRFTGHVGRFYSVAEHSWWVSHHVPSHLALTALLHDASEAYIGDISTPLKNHLKLNGIAIIDVLENRIHNVIANKFGTVWPHPVAVHKADAQMLQTEESALMRNYYSRTFPPFDIALECWEPERAEQEFLDRFNLLSKF